MRQMRACVVLLFVSLCLGCAGPRAVFVVRHAERADDSDDTALSSAGQARAAALAEGLAQAGVTALYTSEFQRSRDTAGPLARRLGLTPRVVPAADGAALARQVRRQRGVVLIVGHSHTIPALLQALGVGSPGGPVRIERDAYDDLFLVLPQPGGGAAHARLRQPQRN